MLHVDVCSWFAHAERMVCDVDVSSRTKRHTAMVLGRRYSPKGALERLGGDPGCILVSITSKADVMNFACFEISLHLFVPEADGL